MVVETKEKKISPAVVIVPIIAFGALAMAFGGKKEEEPEPPPEGWTLLDDGIAVVTLKEVASPAFTFSNVAVRSEVCPTATAYWIAIFDCRISNPTDQTITHSITYWMQGYSYTYGEWRDPRAIESFDMTLEPGASYDYHNSGITEGGGCWPPLMMHYDYYFWLEDELGNQSAKVKIYRP